MTTPTPTPPAGRGARLRDRAIAAGLLLAAVLLALKPAGLTTKLLAVGLAAWAVSRWSGRHRLDATVIVVTLLDALYVAPLSLLLLDGRRQSCRNLLVAIGGGDGLGVAVLGISILRLRIIRTLRLGGLRVLILFGGSFINGGASSVGSISCYGTGGVLSVVSCILGIGASYESNGQGCGSKATYDTTSHLLHFCIILSSRK